MRILHDLDAETIKRLSSEVCQLYYTHIEERPRLLTTASSNPGRPPFSGLISKKAASQEEAKLLTSKSCFQSVF